MGNMTGYEIYVLFVCIAVFACLTLLLTGLLAIIVRQYLTAVDEGSEDIPLINEYYDAKARPKPFFHTAWGKVAIAAVTVLFAVFAYALYADFSTGVVEGGMAVPKVVLSESMSYKHPANTYLEENKLEDQFQMFDLIMTRALPPESELELYDVVVYEYRGDLIIHRIIAIEEPNDKHPDCRYFTLRGDAVRYSDEFQVKYSQMRAIYEGERIPYVGSFIAFMQSTAGYMCILLVVFSMIALPITEKYIKRRKEDRLYAMGYIADLDA